jgi:hypothetical protein
VFQQVNSPLSQPRCLSVISRLATSRPLSSAIWPGAGPSDIEDSRALSLQSWTSDVGACHGGSQADIRSAGQAPAARPMGKSGAVATSGCRRSNCEKDSRLDPEQGRKDRFAKALHQNAVEIGEESRKTPLLSLSIFPSSRHRPMAQAVTCFTPGIRIMSTEVTHGTPSAFGDAYGVPGNSPTELRPPWR